MALARPLAAAPADELLPFLVQSACLDRAGAVQPGRLPFEPGCERLHPLEQGTPLPWRKHDWPARQHAAALPLGYQASDSLRGSLLGRPAILQSLDFGDTRRAFGRYDRGLGDGGQAVVLRGTDAALILTEDGSGGRQWLLGPDCDAGWLLAAAPLSESWQQRLVRLNIARTPDACPRSFGPSLTRWRLAHLALPWRDAASGATASAPVEALVSEHYAGTGIGNAHHLERFWFGRHLGLLRWERWENPALGRREGLESRARLIAESARCPEITLSGPPAPDWQMVDCRTWSNFNRAAPGQPLSAPGWPGGLDQDRGR